MARRPEFIRLFREVTQSSTRREVAERIGCTPSYVTQLREGANNPSRDLMERIIRAYDLDWETWMRAAAFLPPLPTAEDARLLEAARHLMEVAKSQAMPPLPQPEPYDARKYLGELFDRLVAHYGGPVVPKRTRIPFPQRDESPEKMEHYAREAEREFRKVTPEARQKAPLFVSEP